MDAPSEQFVYFLDAFESLKCVIIEPFFYCLKHQVCVPLIDKVELG